MAEYGDLSNSEYYAARGCREQSVKAATMTKSLADKAAAFQSRVGLAPKSVALKCEAPINAILSHIKQAIDGYDALQKSGTLGGRGNSRGGGGGAANGHVRTGAIVVVRRGDGTTRVAQVVPTDRRYLSSDQERRGYLLVRTGAGRLARVHSDRSVWPLRASERKIRVGGRVSSRRRGAGTKKHRHRHVGGGVRRVENQMPGNVYVRFYKVLEDRLCVRDCVTKVLAVASPLLLIPNNTNIEGIEYVSLTQSEQFTPGVVIRMYWSDDEDDLAESGPTLPTRGDPLVRVSALNLLDSTRVIAGGGLALKIQRVKNMVLKGAWYK